MKEKFLEKKIEFWKEMFSYTLKLAILVASALIVDVRAKGNFELIDILGGGFFYVLILVMIISVYKWVANINKLESNDE